VLIAPSCSNAYCPQRRNGFVELLQMTDLYTDEIFARTAAAEDTLIEFPISRLIVDAERFVNDQQEIMSRRGMGVVYLQRHDGTPLRADLSDKDRLERIPVMFEHSRHGERNFCILAG
jgi:N-formylglutamate deformylase